MYVRVTVPLQTKEGVIPEGTELDLPDPEAEALLRETLPPVVRVEIPAVTEQPKPTRKRRPAKKAPE